MEFSSLQLEIAKQKGTGIIWLNRPEFHNAVNEVMIQEIIQAFDKLNKNEKVRLIIFNFRIFGLIRRCLFYISTQEKTNFLILKNVILYLK